MLSGRNIVLIGFMGTGKTTVGKALAKRIGRRLEDVDHRIEETTRRKIADIFEKDGEAFFRKIEKEAIAQISKERELIITTGGGAVLDPENMTALKKNGFVIALLANAETIYKRVKESRHRPLLKGGAMKVEIEKLIAVRKPYYEKADLLFVTDGKTSQQVADEIYSRIENDELECGKDWF